MFMTQTRASLRLRRNVPPRARSGLSRRIDAIRGTNVDLTELYFFCGQSTRGPPIIFRFLKRDRVGRRSAEKNWEPHASL
jgi:hypothetical protein